jgi:glycosyltransferase involved in cell wall biosynthesis
MRLERKRGVSREFYYIMLISIIIPSRAQINPNSARRELWLERAIASAQRQTITGHMEWEVIVGLDPGITLPVRLEGAHVVNARKSSQAAAVNEAVSASRGEFIAILEDDDVWEPQRLEVGLDRIDRFDLVTSNQKEVTCSGEFVRINDFPTPSGWLLRRATWDEIGPFDDSLVFHVDNDYLGRMAAAGKSRIHLVEFDAPSRPWLEMVAQFSEIERTGHRDPLVTRTVNPDGGIGQIMRLSWARNQSKHECSILKMKYGIIQW